MSQLTVIAGTFQDDNIAISVNSNDSDACIYIDYLSNTDDFVRSSYELSISDQMHLITVLAKNIKKWR